MFRCQRYGLNQDTPIYVKKTNYPINARNTTRENNCAQKSDHSRLMVRRSEIGPPYVNMPYVPGTHTVLNMGTRDDR